MTNAIPMSILIKTNMPPYGTNLASNNPKWPKIKMFLAYNKNVFDTCSPSIDKPEMEGLEVTFDL